MKPLRIRLTHEDGGRSNGCRWDDPMHMDDRDIPETLDPRLEHIERLLALDAARRMAAAPSGLVERIHSASAGLTPRSIQTRPVRYSSMDVRAVATRGFGRRLALAACMGLVFLGGIWAIGQHNAGDEPEFADGTRVIPEVERYVGDVRPDGFSAFLTPIGDDEISDDRAAVSVLELGDAEFWAVEAELSALESVLRVH